MYYEKYKNQAVRDMAWAIASPPLIIPDSTKCCWYNELWYQHLYSVSAHWLHELDKQPEPLQERIDSQKDRRMGKYFETLWAFWLEQDKRFELLQQNLPLRECGNTLGELDFLLLDKTTGKYLHWEMAVKFYLGVGDTRLQANWFGPAKKDRLDKKVLHLQQRQSVIGMQTRGRELLQELGLRVDGCGVILKGRLFYDCGALRPNLYPVDAYQGHEKGIWLTMSRFAQHYAEAEAFCPLLKNGWMATSLLDETADYISKNKVLESISAGRYRLPLYLGQHPENTATGRIFLVSDDWSQSL